MTELHLRHTMASDRTRRSCSPPARLTGLATVLAVTAFGWTVAQPAIDLLTEGACWCSGAACDAWETGTEAVADFLGRLTDWRTWVRLH